MMGNKNRVVTIYFSFKSLKEKVERSKCLLFFGVGIYFWFIVFGLVGQIYYYFLKCKNYFINILFGS